MENACGLRPNADGPVGWRTAVDEFQPSSPFLTTAPGRGATFRVTLPVVLSVGSIGREPQWDAFWWLMITIRSARGSSARWPMPATMWRRPATRTAAIERLQNSQFDVVLTDLRMGGADGMDVLRTTRSIQPGAAVILMTAFGSIHTAVEAMKIGAFDFVQKPFEIEELELKIEKAIEFRHLKYEVEHLRQERAPVVKIPPTGIPLQEIERQAVVEALRMSNWVQKTAAELLGISPRVMNYKIKILSIEMPRSRRVVTTKTVSSNHSLARDALTSRPRLSAASLRPVLIAALLLATPPAPQTAAEYQTTRRSLLNFAEVALARMGYLQGPFSGEATSALRAAVSAYESDRRLPITGDPLSARTFDHLGADIKKLSHEPVGVPSSSFLDSYWDDGYASSTGTWMIEHDEVAFPEQTTQVTCERDRNGMQSNSRLF